MTYDTLCLENEKQITVLSLNQPHNKNCMTKELQRDFHSAITAVKNDDGCRVLIITGVGDSFCSGGDLQSTFDLFDDPPFLSKANVVSFYRSFLSVRDLDIPTIAMINGHAIGAGLCLALACDMRIAAQQAKMAISFIKLGLHPGMGGSYLLPRLVGTAKAFELCLTGKTIGAEEALHMGMVNHVVPAGELKPFTLEFAAQIARNPAVPARLLKKSIYRNFESDLDSALDYESSAQVICSLTEDMREGVAAIKEKRLPVFKGC